MKNNLPYVRVGIPVFNEERYIGQAIESVLQQDYPNLEILVADNASTDGTRRVCETLARSDARIRYIRHEVNRGASENFRYVFEGCEAPYFIWVGSHDVLKPDFISKCIVAHQNNPDTVLAYPRTQIIDSDDNVLIEVTPDRIDTQMKPTKERVLQIVRELTWCNMMYGVFRTMALSKCRQYVFCRGPDHVLLMEISLLGSIELIPEVLFIRREHRSDAFEPLSEDEYTIRQLKRLKPDAFDLGPLRPHWKMGFEHILGILRARIPLVDRLGLLAPVTITFALRWRKQLWREIFHPLHGN